MDGLDDIIARIVDAGADWFEWNIAGGKEQAELQARIAELEAQQRLEQMRVAAEQQRTMLLAVAGVAAVGLAAWALRG